MSRPRLKGAGGSFCGRRSVVLAGGGNFASAGGPQEKRGGFDWEWESGEWFVLHVWIAASLRREETVPRQKV
jgi:hypothetical protein